MQLLSVGVILHHAPSAFIQRRRRVNMQIVKVGLNNYIIDMALLNNSWKMAYLCRVNKNITRIPKPKNRFIQQRQLILCIV